GRIAPNIEFRGGSTVQLSGHLASDPLLNKMLIWIDRTSGKVVGSSPEFLMRGNSSPCTVLDGRVYAYTAHVDLGGDPCANVSLNMTVVVTARDIPIGVTITGEMVEMKALPEAAVVTGSVRATEDVVGQRVRYPATKGEQFTSTRLIDPQKVPALSFQIPPGRRGFTI